MVRKTKGNYTPVPEGMALKISADVNKFAEIMDFFKTIVRGLTNVGIAYFVYRIVAILCLSLAGKETVATIGINLSFAWPLATFGSVCWAVGERKNKGNQIRRLSAENKELKRRLDPNVGSSSLRPNGETRLEDKL